MRNSKYTIESDHMHLIMTDDDKDYRFGRIVLVKLHFYSRKLTVFDAVSGAPVRKIKHYMSSAKNYYEADIDSFAAVGFRTYDYELYYIDDRLFEDEENSQNN